MSRIIELISEVEKVRVLNDIREEEKQHAREEEKLHALCCHSEKPAIAWKDAT